ncbi:MAG: TerB family tellurite resistance protein [Phenylobacterium sp.]|uniref:tellurite resistance TerB family protein n=1 Tax=Phenylobacterium sp. TaxID=1871053 RepID=UPI00271DC18D|nr:TerB family tellurite resistance protein [Phenylobacterium sp.]MDO9429864.1 TerB family tellurite resistance protein [Phenylobacterium sp.]
MNSLNLDHFVTARVAFRRRLTGARAERLGKRIGGSEFDDHGMLVEVDDPPAPPLAFHMVYSDAKQQLSGRCITLRNLLHEVAEVRLTAYCHMRNALRTFVASRVVELTDLATGEVHEDGLAYFRQHPLLGHATADDLTNRSAELLAVQACRDEIIILSFVGASDGDFDEDEQNEILKHVLLSVDEQLNENEVRRRVQSWVPDERAFERALARICAGEGDAKALMRSMRRVIDADGEVDSEEVAFASEVQTRLIQAGRL